MNNRLPKSIRSIAIQYAQNAIGIHRPVKEHLPIIKAWEQCYIETRKYLRREDGKKRKS